MSILRGFFPLTTALLLLLPLAHARKPIVGDGDPFPLQCVDFTGHWRADNGTRYNIAQTNCKRLKIIMLWKNQAEGSFSLVPDNLSRTIPGKQKSAIRNRWNSSRMGSVLESRRTYVENGNKISEVVIYERASEGLLLETVYSKIESLSNPEEVVRDYKQQVFRKVNKAEDFGFERNRSL